VVLCWPFAVYEYNSRGKIPYLPVVKAPYYQWIGKRRDYTGMESIPVSKYEYLFHQVMKFNVPLEYVTSCLSGVLLFVVMAEKNLVRFPARASDEFEAKRPSAFPPTFLYSLSWEDPREDDKFLNINKDDTVLTLTSGGCNALDLVYQVSQTAQFN